MFAPELLLDNPIPREKVYELLCLYSADEGRRDAISARGWLKYSCYYDMRIELICGYSIIMDHLYNFYLHKPFDDMWAELTGMVKQ